MRDKLKQLIKKRKLEGKNNVTITTNPFMYLPLASNEKRNMQFHTKLL